MEMDNLLDDNESEIIWHEDFRIDGLTTIMDRVRHFFVDFISIILIAKICSSQIISFYFHSSSEKPKSLNTIVLFLVYFLYYFVCESYFNLTLGKFFNRTRVFNSNELKPTFKQVFLRTICRLIPFGFVTIWLPYQRTLHDTISDTWVLRIKKKHGNL